MVSLRTMADRLVLSMAGSTTRIRTEFSLPQARALHAEIGDLIASIELGEARPNTLQDLIDQIARP